LLALTTLAKIHADCVGNANSTSFHNGTSTAVSISSHNGTSTASLTSSHNGTNSAIPTFSLNATSTASLTSSHNGTSSVIPSSSLNATSTAISNVTTTGKSCLHLGATPAPSIQVSQLKQTSAKYRISLQRGIHLLVACLRRLQSHRHRLRHKNHHEHGQLQQDSPEIDNVRLCDEMRHHLLCHKRFEHDFPFKYLQRRYDHILRQGRIHPTNTDMQHRFQRLP
jgi:hypothetical protein